MPEQPMCVHTAPEAHAHLVVDLGWDMEDAYDLLADAGYDPHRNAHLTLITSSELATLCSQREATIRNG